MTSVLGSVTSWLVGVRDPSPERQVIEIGGTSPTSQQAGEEGSKEVSPSSGSVGTESGEDVAKLEGQTKSPGDDGKDDSAKTLPGGLDVDLQEVSEKAIHAAKEWGSYLFNFGKAATEQVAKTAKQLKDTMEEKTILGDFSREQEKFVSTNRERKKQSEAAVAPWVGYNEEEAMKTQILALSKDKRNVLRNPPSGVQFYFDYESIFPIAMVMLDEDPNLKALRFELVPKQVKEEMFWRNYFYRVSLIKQSTQLTSMTHQRGAAAVSSGKSSPADSGSKTTPRTGVEEKETEELNVGSPPGDQEFVSDTFQAGEELDEDLKREMHQLGVTDSAEVEEDIPEWERELQAELQEYEVVGDDENNVDDADLEREIMNQIEAESKHT